MAKTLEEVVLEYRTLKDQQDAKIIQANEVADQLKQLQKEIDDLSPFVMRARSRLLTVAGGNDVE